MSRARPTPFIRDALAEGDQARWSVASSLRWREVRAPLRVLRVATNQFAQRDRTSSWRLSVPTILLQDPFVQIRHRKDTICTTIVINAYQFLVQRSPTSVLDDLDHFSGL